MTSISQWICSCAMMSLSKKVAGIAQLHVWPSLFMLLVLVCLVQKGMFAQILAVGVVSLSDLASPGI